MMMTSTRFHLDHFAMRLAARDGYAWSDLSEYPGYARNMWREEARMMILRENPEAMFERLPTEWNGREGGFIVRTGRAAEQAPAPDAVGAPLLFQHLRLVTACDT